MTAWSDLSARERMEVVEGATVRTRPDRQDWISLGLFALGFTSLIFAWGCFA